MSRHLFENSYVLSEFVVWWEQIKWTPRPRIPVPRYLSHRDS